LIAVFPVNVARRNVTADELSRAAKKCMGYNCGHEEGAGIKVPCGFGDMHSLAALRDVGGGDKENQEH
jgi:hypothetical protein